MLPAPRNPFWLFVAICPFPKPAAKCRACPACPWARRGNRNGARPMSEWGRLLICQSQFCAQRRTLSKMHTIFHDPCPPTRGRLWAADLRTGLGARSVTACVALKPTVVSRLPPKTTRGRRRVDYVDSSVCTPSLLAVLPRGCPRGRRRPRFVSPLRTKEHITFFDSH